MKVLTAAQAKLNVIMAGRNIMISLTRYSSPEADRVYEVVEDVLLYSETDKKGIGQLIVVDVTGRIVSI